MLITVFYCWINIISGGGRGGGGHRNCQDWAHRIFKHKKSSGQSLSEKFSSRFYATSHRTEVAHFELGKWLFRSICILLLYSSQSSFRPAFFFSRRRFEHRSFLLGGMISCICSTEHACVCCVLCRFWWSSQLRRVGPTWSNDAAYGRTPRAFRSATGHWCEDMRSCHPMKSSRLWSNGCGGFPHQCTLHANMVGSEMLFCRLPHLSTWWLLLSLQLAFTIRVLDDLCGMCCRGPRIAWAGVTLEFSFCARCTCGSTCVCLDTHVALQQGTARSMWLYMYMMTVVSLWLHLWCC